MYQKILYTTFVLVGLLLWPSGCQYRLRFLSAPHGVRSAVAARHRQDMRLIWRAAQNLYPEKTKGTPPSIEPVYDRGRWSTLVLVLPRKVRQHVIGLYAPDNKHIYIKMLHYDWRRTVAHEIVHWMGYDEGPLLDFMTEAIYDEARRLKRKQTRKK